MPALFFLPLSLFPEFPTASAIELYLRNHRSECVCVDPVYVWFRVRFYGRNYEAFVDFLLSTENSFRFLWMLYLPHKFSLFNIRAINGLRKCIECNYPVRTRFVYCYDQTMICLISIWNTHTRKMIWIFFFFSFFVLSYFGFCIFSVICLSVNQGRKRIHLSFQFSYS